MAGVEKIPEEYKRNLMVFDPLPSHAPITPQTLVQKFDGSLVLNGVYYGVRFDMASGYFRSAKLLRVDLPLRKLESPAAEPVLNLVPDPSKGLAWKMSQQTGEVTLVDAATSQRLDNIANRRLRYHRMFIRERGREPFDEFDFENWRTDTISKRMPAVDLSKPNDFVEDWLKMIALDDNIPMGKKVDFNP